MPRTQEQRVAQRAQIDSSQSANVALPVTASLHGIAARGGAMFALGQALNGMSAQLGSISAQNTRQIAEQNTKASKAAGAAKANEKNVTGEEPTDWLKSANDIERQSYQETDGINAVGRFEQSIQPEIARLEPGADIDGFIQQHAEKFLTDNELPEKTKQTFLTGLSRSQQAIKETYLRQSLAESLKRNEESGSALLVSGLQNGSATSPEGYAKWREYMTTKGMHEDEIDAMAVKAVQASIQSGDVDIDAAMALMKASTSAGRPALADIPQYKQDLQLAMTAGQRVQKQRKEQAQAEEFTHVSYQLNDAADKGVLSDHRIDQARNQFGQTPEWAVALHNRNREAQDRLAKAAAKANDQRVEDADWLHYDPLKTFKDGYSDTKMGEAGDRALRSALDSGDIGRVNAVVDHAMRTGAPIKSLKTVLTRGIDPSNPQQATRYAQIFERARNISPTRAADLIDDSTRVKLVQYENAKMLGSSDMEAWGKVSQGAEVAPEVASKITTDAMKLVSKELPADFNDGGWFGHDTPIANGSELQTAALLKTRDMVQAGADAKTAAEAAVKWVQDSYIRSGDRMVRAYGTGDGMNDVTSEAMTEAGTFWKDKLVKDNAVDPDASVWFAPVEGAPNRWRLMKQEPGGYWSPVVHEVPVKAPDGTERTESQFVDVIPSAARVNFSAWKKQEEDKKVRNAQALSQLGQTDTDLTPGNVKALNERFGKLLNAQRPDFATSNDNEAARAEHARQWDLSVEHARKVSEYINNPSNQRQTFAEFITSQH